MTYQDAQRAVHEAIGKMLDDDEFAVAWTLTIDVQGGEHRYLAHRAGGGIDGTESPMAWTALGMLRASVGVAEAQIRGMTEDAQYDDEDEEDDEGEPE